MGDRDSNNWVPIVAGVVVGAGILTLIYKMFFSTKPHEPIEIKLMRVNQQIKAPYKCTCDSGGIDPVSIKKPDFLVDFSNAEEQERKKRERERARRNRLAQEAEQEVTAASREPPPPPPPRFSVLQLALGTTTCMLALAALLFTKVLDQDTAHALLSKVGLGQLIPKRELIGGGGIGGVGGIGGGSGNGVDGDGGVIREVCPVKLDPCKRRWPLDDEAEERSCD